MFNFYPPTHWLVSLLLTFGKAKQLLTTCMSMYTANYGLANVAIGKNCCLLHDVWFPSLHDVVILVERTAICCVNFKFVFV